MYFVKNTAFILKTYSAKTKPMDGIDARNPRGTTNLKFQNVKTTSPVQNLTADCTRVVFVMVLLSYSNTPIASEFGLRLRMMTLHTCSYLHQ